MYLIVWWTPPVSRIEGTETTLTELFEAEAAGRYGDDVQEVVNYIAAMNRGLALLSSGQRISIQLIEEIHAQLLEGVRGEGKNPGTLRSTPNWIAGTDPLTALFVPPPADRMREGLRDWEDFANEDLLMPPLIRCALLHYQFETLHPFLDGNGRLGRLLIIFFLVADDHLPQPLLYVSSFSNGKNGGTTASLSRTRPTKRVARDIDPAVHRSSQIHSVCIARSDVVRVRFAIEDVFVVRPVVVRSAELFGRRECSEPAIWCGHLIE